MNRNGGNADGKLVNRTLLAAFVLALLAFVASFPETRAQFDPLPPVTFGSDLYYFLGQYETGINDCIPPSTAVHVFSWPLPGKYNLATCVWNRDHDSTNDDRLAAVITENPAFNCSTLDPRYVTFPAFQYAEHIGQNYIVTCIRSGFTPPAVASGGFPITNTSCPPFYSNVYARSEFIAMNYVTTCAPQSILIPLTISCEGIPNPALLPPARPAELRWHATAGGGITPYTYRWSLANPPPSAVLDPLITTTNVGTNDVRARYATEGLKHADLEVLAGTIRATTTCSAYVIDFRRRETNPTP